MERFRIKTESRTTEKYTVVCGSVRFSVITPCLLRVEISKNGQFCDAPTQSVINRDFCATPFSYRKNTERILIKTSGCEFDYSLKEKKMTGILLSDGRTVTDFRKGVLPGTCRTLDMTVGRTPLENGIISRGGVAVLNDSDTLVLTEDGRIVPRESKEKDEYYFAYGFDYRAAVKDFFNLSGHAPLIPRFALGNWWSRYKAYTQDEYVTLMQRFIDEKIPVTVATVDMDWHWVDVVRKFGRNTQTFDPTNFRQVFYDIMSPGWTGYSWNTDLFPDPKAFLNWLHEKNFKVTLNIHPASGVKYFEDQYDALCEVMGADKTKKQRISFDITDEKFLEGYFDCIHHPHENDGVDFWWIDWQQGKKTKTPGLDPLWALNHYHYLDNCRDGKRGMILSRFAGPGSQRYPLGFSGDTAQTWSCLNFQPYFTATASNIGYTWWSHDIGGHHSGIRDDELYLRWLQFGVFSPVNRLHSTSNEFMGKEPWKYRGAIRAIAEENLRFRHRLLPYLYTMNYRTANDGLALMEPMYYAHPRTPESYTVPNQYMFGTELICAPITKPADKKINMADTEVWLPEGRYTDIFNGRIYNGGRKIKMFRDETSIPVLAREGSIIPLSARSDTNDWKNPADMEILVFRGNGKFTMYEDDGETFRYKDGHSAFTDFEVKENGKETIFRIASPRGDLSVLPEKRKYMVTFRDIAAAEEITVRVGGRKIPVKKTCENGCLGIILTESKLPYDAEIVLNGVTPRTSGDKKEYMIDLFSKIQGLNNPKQFLYTKFVLENKPLMLHGVLKDAVEEINSLYFG